MRRLLLAVSLGVAHARKIGTQEPIKEILTIFVTLGGVALLLVALVMYFRNARLPHWLDRLISGHQKQ